MCIKKKKKKAVVWYRIVIQVPEKMATPTILDYLLSICLRHENSLFSVTKVLEVHLLIQMCMTLFLEDVRNLRSHQ